MMHKHEHKVVLVDSLRIQSAIFTQCECGKIKRFLRPGGAWDCVYKQGDTFKRSWL